MKKHNIIKVVLTTILLLVMLTWIFPAAYFSSAYIEQGRVQVGLFDLFNYPMTALSYFGHIALYVLVIGGFYGIMHKIPAYRAFLDKLANTLKKKGKLSLSIIMILLAVITSICGLQIGLMLFFPMIVSVILLMGYDKMVAALTLVGSTMIGMVGSTYAYSNNGISLSVLGLDIGSEILTKFIILALGLILLIVNTVLYIRKGSTVKVSTKKTSVKAEKIVEEEVVEKKAAKKAPAKKTPAKKSKSSKTTTKSSKTTTKKTKSSRKDIKAALKDEDVIVVKEVATEDVYMPSQVKGKYSIWPFVVLFAILFLIMILAFIPWADAFNLAWFTDATKAVSEFELFKFNIFGKLLGTVNAFGTWTTIDLVTVLFIITVLVTVIYKVKFDDILDGFVNGVKKALPLAIIIILIYTCLVITTYHPFQLVIYKAIIGLSKKVDLVCAFASSLVGLLAGLFNVESAYAFQSVLPYFTSVITDTARYPIIDVIFQSMYGFAMLFAPTSVVLMTVLAYLDISYGKWLKTIWKLLLELLAVLLIIFVILVLL